jgi:hypothetical protein
LEVEQSMGSGRLQAAAFGLALAALLGLVAGGIYRSAAVDGRPPPLRNDYGVWLGERASRGDWQTVLRALRSATALDLGNARVESDLIPLLVELAGRMGDRDSELAALRALAERRRSDPRAHDRLASAILSARELDGAARREAAAHSRIALALDPDDAVARANLARLAASDGGAS